MQIRKAVEKDLHALLLLYAHLKEQEPALLPCDKALAVWHAILQDPKQHVLVLEENGALLSSCVVVLIQNLTHNMRLYALVENVVTHKQYRNRGFASSVLGQAVQLAKEENCYKIMLMTGAKTESTLQFYERAGFNKKDKTAFIQWL